MMIRCLSGEEVLWEYLPVEGRPFDIVGPQYQVFCAGSYVLHKNQVDRSFA